MPVNIYEDIITSGNFNFMSALQRDVMSSFVEPSDSAYITRKAAGVAEVVKVGVALAWTST